MYGPCLPGRPELLSGSRSASSPVPPSPENRQGYMPPDTVSAPKNSSPMGHSVSFCILLTPSARPIHLCRTNYFILYCIKLYGASKGVATTNLRQFSSNFGTLKILTWILSQEYHQPLQNQDTSAASSWFGTLFRAGCNAFPSFGRKHRTWHPLRHKLFIFF